LLREQVFVFDLNIVFIFGSILFIEPINETPSSLPNPDRRTNSAMAKDRESSKPSHAHAEKEEKKKKKRSDEDGVHKSSDKKDKKEKKAKREALAEKALNEIQTAPAAADAKSDDEGEIAEAEAEIKGQELKPVGALVPFANPLADEKVAKKVFKSVKKGS
jgi:H/ACA ribonucleoprotein complex subunit 2